MSIYIGDEDERYVCRLADYIGKREGIRTAAFFETEDFTQALFASARNCSCSGDVFLLDERFYEKLLMTGNKTDLIKAFLAEGRICCLTCDRQKDGERFGEITFIYKYKSASGIIEAITQGKKTAAGATAQFDPGIRRVAESAQPVRVNGPAGVNGSVRVDGPAGVNGFIRSGESLRVIPVERKNAAVKTTQASETRNLTEEITKLTRQVRQELEILPEINDETVLKLIDEIMKRTVFPQSLTPGERLELKVEAFNSIRRLDVLQSLMDDESVTEIMVNGMHNIFIEREGRLYDSNRAFSSKERLQDIIQQIAAGANRTVNTASPILDARLPDGARVSVVLEPVAINGPILTIRRFPKTPISDLRLIETGSATREVLDFMRLLVEAKYNIIISGGTGSGKTTFLNILSGYIPTTERIITIEDSAELQLRGIENLVSLETRNANTEGVKPITIRDLIKASLRMRPDRIVVGEVRGEEAIDMLQAMNVGMDGSLSTIHANSAKDALSRLAAMMLMNTDIPLTAIRTQICSGVDIIVQLGRLRDKSRRLLEVIEVVGYKDDEIQTRTLFSFREEGEQNGRVIGGIVMENELLNRDKLQRAGLDYELQGIQAEP